MPGFTSLKYDFHESRETLRLLLRRALDRDDRVVPRPTDGPRELRDDQVLAALLSVQEERGLDAKEAEAIVAASGSAVTFADMVRDGWFTVSLGRVFASYELARAVAGSPSATRVAVERVLAERHGRGRARGGPLPSDPAAAALADTLLADRDARPPATASPEWVGARLWEEAGRFISGPERLELWLDALRLLPEGWPTPSRVWGPKAQAEFADAAFEIIARESGILGWNEERLRIAAEWDIERGNLPSAATAKLVAEPPQSLVQRADWVEQRGITYALRGSRERIGAIIHVLLRDAATAAIGRAPHLYVGRLLELAADRPFVLQAIVSATSRMPVLIADLLLLPSATALALKLIADATLPSSAWDTEVRHADAGRSRSAAFAAGADALAHFLGERKIPFEELTELLVWLHGMTPRLHWETGRPTFDANLLATLRRRVFAGNHDVALSCTKVLLTAPTRLPVGTPRFAALLDLLSTGNLVEEIEPASVITGYVDSLAAIEHSTTLATVTPDGAAALATLARRGDDTLWRAFLGAEILVTQVQALAAAPASDDSFVRRSEVEHRIRAQVRVLARAARGWPDGARAELIDAIATLVRLGARDDLTAGHIPAFAPRHETHVSSTEPPIGVDLGELLRAVSAPDRAKLIEALGEVDEPQLLAKVASQLSHDDAATLRRRIDRLEPHAAASLWPLTELEGRIDALIDLNALDAAERFVAVEQETETWGPVRERPLQRLRTSLRLLYARGKFDEILALQLSEELQGSEGARDLVRFYEGLAHIAGSAGRPERAVEAFRTLRAREPGNVTYAVNYVAARVRSVQPADANIAPTPTERVAIRTVLREAEQIDAELAISGPARLGFCLNRARLELTLGDNEAAVDTLRTIPLEAAEDESVMGLMVLALTRLGRSDEAAAWSDHARAMYGATTTTRDAAAILPPSPAVVEPASPLVELQRAWAQIGKLDPEEKAQVWLFKNPALRPLLTNLVRRAAATTADLPSHVRDRAKDWNEDDITEVLSHLLSPHVEVLGWQTKLQSRGGTTAKTNRAERDLVIAAAASEELAVLEAVKCDGNPRTKFATMNLTEHFQRLFATGRTRISFHVTYSFWKDATDLVDALKTYATTTDGLDWKLDRVEDLRADTSLPAGFVAHYSGPRPVEIVFIALTLTWAAEEAAALVADKQNPRKQVKPRSGDPNQLDPVDPTTD